MEQIAEHQLAPTGGFGIAGILGGIVAAAIAAVVGGMPGVVVALALVLAVRVYQHPEEAIVAGPLYIMACEILLPSSTFVDAQAQPLEMYYWATGLVLITLAAFLKLGCKPLFEVPRSLLYYTLVALAASVYGFSTGAQPSYVLRQLFGALLLGAYFALALRGVSEEFFLRKLRFYAVGCALAFCVHYALVFGTYGVHKEWTALPTQCTILAIAFVARRGWKWQAATGIMLLPSLLDVMRRNFAEFALGLALIWAFSATTRLRRRLSWVLAGVIVTATLVPSLVDMMLSTATEARLFDQFLPEGTRDSATIVEREMQLLTALTVLQNSPVFGSGMGSSLESWRSWGATVDIPYVDNGWAHLIVKMGIAGILTFGWFIVNMVSWMPGRSVGFSASLLSMLALGTFSEPVFFNFQTSLFLGAVAGLLYVGHKQKTSDTNNRRLALAVSQ